MEKVWTQDMQSKLTPLLRRLHETISQRDGVSLARFLKWENVPLAQQQDIASVLTPIARKQAADEQYETRPLEVAIDAYLPTESGMRKLVTEYLLLITDRLLATGEPKDRHDIRTNGRCGRIATGLGLALGEQKGGWLAPAVMQFLKEWERLVRGESIEKRSEIVEKVVSLWGKCRADQPDAHASQTNRILILPLVNLWCHCTFSMDTLGMMRQMLRNIDNLQLPFHEYPEKDVAIWRYYKGRFLFSEGFAREAAEELGYTWQHTPRQLNDKLAPFVVASRLLMGTLARPEQVSSDPSFIACMTPLIKAFRYGDLKSWRDKLDGHASWLITWAGYTWLMARGTPVVWRNLIRRVWLLTRDVSRANVLEIKYVHGVVTWLGEDVVSLAETEHAVMNLIDQGFIRGYIHMGQHVLVLGKEDPFPKLADITYARY